MADTTYSRWYREGSVTISQNSKTLQGANTYWLNANIKPGDLFTIDSSKFYEVDSVDSNTQITLRTAFEEAKITAGAYKIIRNFTATLAAETAAKVVEVLARNERYVNEDMKTVQGYSAYDLACQGGYVGTLEQWLASLTAYGVARERGFSGSKDDWLASLTAYGVACANGYEGTAAEWLESLKAAQEWTTLNERTEILTYHNGTSHNARPRGKNLGSEYTAAQAAAIKAGTFLDLYPGDYWEKAVTYTYKDPNTGEDITETTKPIKFILADCDYFYQTGIEKMHSGIQTRPMHHVVVIAAGKVYSAPMNDENTAQTGYAYSAMRLKYLDRARQYIYAAFGKENIPIFSMQSSLSVSDEGVVKYGFFDSNANTAVAQRGNYALDVELLTMDMITGTNFAQPPLSEKIAIRNTTWTPTNLGRLAIYNYAPTFFFGFNNEGGVPGFFWTQDVASVTTFMRPHLQGYPFATVATASNSVIPFFLLGDVK